MPAPVKFPLAIQVLEEDLDAGPGYRRVRMLFLGQLGVCHQMIDGTVIPGKPQGILCEEYTLSPQEFKQVMATTDWDDGGEPV